MGHSQRLEESDIRSVIRLVREVCELGDDPYAWRRHLFASLDPLIGARLQSAFVGELPFDPSSFRFLLQLNLGVDECFDRYVANGDVSDNPITPYIVARLQTGFTSPRQQMCSDNQWYMSSCFNTVYRPVRCDHSLVSVVGLPGLRRFSGLGFARPLGDKPFGRREGELLDLIHTELAAIWQDSTQEQTAPKLSRRLNEVLVRLKNGISEKEIAYELGLSKHTVHDYVKELHRRFGVASRFELTQRASVRRFVPQLV